MKRGRTLTLWMALVWIGVAMANGDAPSALSADMYWRVAELNQIRVAQGLPPVKLNPELSRAAETQAHEILQMGRCSHLDRWGRRADARAMEVGYHYFRLGENLAAGQRNWQRALTAWLHSPSHRANMLRPDYREVGVGMAVMPNSRYHYAWAQVFGTRPSVYPVIINLDAPYTDSPLVQIYVHGAGFAERMRLSHDGVNWTDWVAPQEWVEWHLPNQAGLHTVYVQLRIRGRGYESHDSIELRFGGQRSQVARHSQGEHTLSPRLLESLRTGVEGTARGEHIVHQHERVSANLFGLDDLERLRHILDSMHPRKPDLRATVKATAQRLGLYWKR